MTAGGPGPSWASTLARTATLGRLGVDVLRTRVSRPGPGRVAAHRLVSQRMGRMRGLPQKIGQILSLADLGGDSPFATLTGAGEPVPAERSFAWIARELGVPLGEVFRSLDPRGLAASIGQVHRGELHDGRQVAVKVRFPDVSSTIDADLAALGWLAAPLSAHRSAFDLAAYREEMRRGLLQEIDYRHEAATLQRFAARAAQVPGLVTPVPVTELSTSGVITMSWVAGDAIDRTADWPEAARHAAALTLLRVFLRGCFEWRELHADPHAGNLRFQRDHDAVQVGVIDFGCVATLSPDASDALFDLAWGDAGLSDAALFDRYVTLGFNPDLLGPMTGHLAAVTAVLFEPFRISGPYDIRRWQLSNRLSRVLGEHRWNFRFAGPASMLFLIRAFQGLVQYLHVLDAALDWRRELAAVRREPVPFPPREPRAAAPSSTGVTPAMQASTLRLRVTRGGAPVVQLTYGAGVVAHLPDLVPEELRERVRSHGVDVATLARTAVDNGCPPGDLFTVTDGDKTVRVWLE